MFIISPWDILRAVFLKSVTIGDVGDNGDVSDNGDVGDVRKPPRNYLFDL